jgi:hypothetical protein
MADKGIIDMLIKDHLWGWSFENAPKNLRFFGGFAIF